MNNLNDPINPTSEMLLKSTISPKNKLINVGFCVLLLVSFVGSGLLFLDNQKLRSDLQKKDSIPLPIQAPTKNISQLPSETVGEDRIGTDPKSEVIPRFFKIFQQEGIKLDPFPCIYRNTCYMQTYQDGKLFDAMNATKLDLFLKTNEEATKYYDRIASILEKNLYTIQPETSNELTDEGTRVRRTDIIHTEKDTICSVEMIAVEGEAGPNGQTALEYPFISLSCTNLNEENLKYISLQQSLISDLKLPDDHRLFVSAYTDNFAMASNKGTCMILKKSNGSWSALDSSGCSDPSWNAREGSLSTVLNRDYGIPIEDALVLAE